MKRRTSIFTFVFAIALCQLSILFSSCKNNKNNYDASGTFEATETIVSAEANGVIDKFNIQEGQTLDSGMYIGYIDTTQLYLKKKQLEAQVKAMGYKLPDISAQTAQFKQQAAVTQSDLNYLLNEKRRTENLLKANAATPKQLDDINAKIATAKEQIKAIYKQGAAQASALNTQRSGISADVQPLYFQIEQLNDQLKKSKIINPVNGTVLTKFAEVNEMATTGKPLYSIADLSTIILRAYITGNQFSFVKLGQKVKVIVDDTASKTKNYDSIIEWISDKAEFTPKTIQTKDERANLVYAIKIRVKNDGYLKIGMYGEVVF
ncbi:MAG TPA: HlyD family efflux transporter periplasmic adaptor subunit [Hanamia sp.]|jgi:HlyD family secretion protein|nr:HlyD family efflux transporter periplasmic adaptor subunit [Hanamia sp.]